MHQYMTKAACTLMAGFLMLSITKQSIAQNVGIATQSPDERLQVGDFGSGQDNWLKIATAGGNLHQAGIKLRHGNNNNGWTLASDAISGRLYLSRQSNSPVADIALAVNGADGHVGIGVVSPQARLHVGGKLMITDGSQGAGKVLTSDANGLASWQPAVRDAYFEHYLMGAPDFVVPHDTETTLHFSIQRWNKSILYLNGTITVAMTGLYHFDVYAPVPWDFNNASRISLRVYVNGVAFDQVHGPLLSRDIVLNAGDQVVFKMIQESGGPITLSPLSRISCHKVN